MTSSHLKSAITAASPELMRNPVRLRGAVALAAGALLACAFAPLQWWPLAVVCPAVLMWLWHEATPREAAWYGFWFNTGTFAAGTYWLYISLHIFGEAPLYVAVFLMLALVAIMGLYYALLGYAVARWLPQRGGIRWLFAVPAAWLLVEWWRGWFLSGFAWLSLGYSQTDTWLASLAPIGGVYALSGALLLGAGALTTLVLGCSRLRLIAALVGIAPWLAASFLQQVQWTQPSGPAVSVAVIQGAVPQDQKWLDSNKDATLALYHDMTERALDHRLIVWPEAAPPELANDLVDWIRDIYRDAQARGAALVFGIVRANDDGDQYYNSVLALDQKVSWYNKSHLVPFAEFFPVPAFVRMWLRLHSLPYADFTRGLADQPALSAGGLHLGATICYEDAYGSSMLHVLRQADALVNVTNDAWFGHSSARHQHFQIARMRALEAGRFLIRAANDGISAVIGPHGAVIARAPEFTPVMLQAMVTPYGGLTPYAIVGNWPVMSVCALLLACSVWVGNHRRQPVRGAAVGTPGAASQLEQA